MSPFEHYPASPGRIADVQRQLCGGADALVAVGQDVARRADVARMLTEGFLPALINQTPVPVEIDAARLAQASLWAGGVLGYFGRAVTDYNGEIDRLNAAWDAAVGGQFGVEPAATGRTPTDGTGEGDDPAALLIADRRAALLHHLRGERDRARDTLDGGADRCAAMLNRGPNLADAKAIKGSGAFDDSVAAGTSPWVRAPLSVLVGEAASFAKYASTHYERNVPGHWIVPPSVDPKTGAVTKGEWKPGSTEPHEPRRAWWAKWAKTFRRLGYGLTGLTVAVEFREEYLRSRDKSIGDRFGRAAAQGLTVGGGAWAGAWAGASLGTLCGPYAPVCAPVAGTAGAYGGAALADLLNDPLVDAGGWTGEHGVQSIIDGGKRIEDAYDTLSELGPWD